MAAYSLAPGHRTAEPLRRFAAERGPGAGALPPRSRTMAKLGRTAGLRHAVAMDGCRVRPAQGSAPRLFRRAMPFAGDNENPAACRGQPRPTTRNVRGRSKPEWL